jgi:AcrR family transcriptional regulator
VSSQPLPAELGQGKRERNKAHNRAAILAAAREVFADLGYGTASVRDIIRGTDLASGTFYNYFPDKEAVFRAILEEDAEEARIRVRAARAAAGDLESFVRDGFRAYFRFLSEEPLTVLMMRRNAGTIRAMFDTPALGAGLEDLVSDLRAAVAAGQLPDHDVEMMASAMIGAGFELGVLMVERDPPDIDGATEMATTLFLGGISRLAG